MKEYFIYGIILLVVIYLFSNKKKPLTPEQIAAQEAENARLAEEKRRLEEKRRAAHLENERLRQEAEKKELETLLRSTQRVYFSYSLVNEQSPIYLLHPRTNDVLETSETSLSQLYSDGWRLLDIDKTGKSAQLEDFNFILRVLKN